MNYFREIFESVLNEKSIKNFPNRGTATKEKMIKVIVNYLKSSDSVFDDSDSGENIEYYLKNSDEASEVRDVLENKYRIVTVKSDKNKGIFWLGFKDKKYDKNGDAIN